MTWKPSDEIVEAVADAILEHMNHGEITSATEAALSALSPHIDELVDVLGLVIEAIGEHWYGQEAECRHCGGCAPHAEDRQVGPVVHVDACPFGLAGAVLAKWGRS